MNVQELRSYVWLEEATGLIYRHSGRQTMRSLHHRGYLKGMIAGKMLLAHRVVWALSHGAWPKDEIDHINRDKSDNRPINLREATRRQNCSNRGSSRGSSSRYLGVTWSKASKKWQAGIKDGGKSTHLGLFDSEDDAALAYNFAAHDTHGNFANYNEATA